jgi:hypothetical protein
MMGEAYVSATTVHTVDPQMMYEYGERRRYNTDRGKAKNWDKNLSQCHFFHHKFHMD